MTAFAQQLREAADAQLTRYAAYLTAMSGDSRKPECAAALHYFAVVVELRPSASPFTDSSKKGPDIETLIPLDELERDSEAPKPQRSASRAASVTKASGRAVGQTGSIVCRSALHGMSFQSGPELSTADVRVPDAGLVVAREDDH